MSRWAIVGLSVLATFAPFGWVLFVSESRWAWIKHWPTMPGAVISFLNYGWLLHFGISVPVRLSMLFAITITLAFPVGMSALVIWKPAWRRVVLGTGLLVSCVLSAIAYRIYLA